MEMTCRDARPLVGAYLDGELSEARASLLRKHLLDCHACRTGAQDGKNLKRWFAATREDDVELAGAVPSGFAARVARRAFSGDVGRSEFGVGVALSAQPVGGPRSSSAESNVLRFVLTTTAIAAGLALILALAARLQGREVGSSMSADDRTVAPVRQVIEELERLNAGGPAPTSADQQR